MYVKNICDSDLVLFQSLAVRGERSYPGVSAYQDVHEGVPRLSASRLVPRYQVGKGFVGGGFLDFYLGQYLALNRTLTHTVVIPRSSFHLSSLYLFQHFV